MDNQKFWNERYCSLPDLGSGPGSRAYAAWVKQRLIAETVAKRNIRSILDIGCGDLCWLQAVPLERVTYTGVDISNVIVARNRANFPQYRFLLHDVANAPLRLTADLVVCLDVLIHQIPLEQFRCALRNVLSSISNIGLISYLTPEGSCTQALPDMPADVLDKEEALLRFLHSADFPKAQTARHGDLSVEIARNAPNASATAIASYPYQTIYEVTLHD